jgi:hypothetical protein
VILAFGLMLSPLAAQAQRPFDPVAFFRGRTHGDGTLKVILKPAKRIAVDSEGSAEKDGWLIVRQVIHEQGKPPRSRAWRMRQTGPNRFGGTLTDAAGPVRVDVHKNGLRIRYKGKDHLDFDQWLTPVTADRVQNRMRVKRFGITIAHFDEVIRKLD